eukprot:TRINITY_DN333_c0_g1_i1.p1 TRINITY_DN333_c0_g1~~TRINITY_DN333_c0_g1_i1.p1  ORF type:complete len:166 (+),score=16.64 TRINITY_DN333_c0_g1_i1:643-1140(+)
MEQMMQNCLGPVLEPRLEPNPTPFKRIKRSPLSMQADSLSPTPQASTSSELATVAFTQVFQSLGTSNVERATLLSMLPEENLEELSEALEMAREMSITRTRGTESAPVPTPSQFKEDPSSVASVVEGSVSSEVLPLFLRPMSPAFWEHQENMDPLSSPRHYSPFM